MGRLRWRMDGALQWPLFVALTVADAILLMVLPISGTGPSLIPALLLAMFFNLVAVAVLGRLAGRLVRRRRPDMPKVVAEDRGGVALLLLVTAALAVGGVIHAPKADEAEDALRAQAEAARAYVLEHGTAQQRANVGAMDTQQHAEDFFRTCFPGDPALCLLIDTSVSPPKVVRDRDASPNRHL